MSLPATKPLEEKIGIALLPAGTTSKDVEFDDHAFRNTHPRLSVRSRRLLKNILTSVLRIAVTACVGILMPSFLTHRLPSNTYGAWVLVLQLGAIVSYLDIGVQAGVSKFISEYEATGDHHGCSIAATCGFRILLCTGAIGMCIIPVLAWFVPTIFHEIPQSLHSDTQIGVLLVGTSLAVNLTCSSFAAIFSGLQKYQVPNTIGIINKVLYAIAVGLAVYLHSSMIVMGALVATINVGTAILQVLAWRRWAGWVHVNASIRGQQILRRMLEYCGILTVWSAAMLCVSGLDLTIVGHFAFAETAYYSIASAPASLLIVLLSAGLGPLMPAVSAQSVTESAVAVGNSLMRITRYSTLFLLLTGLPIILFGSQILHIWVGSAYEHGSLPLLRILILANIVRYLLGPYATFVVATARQRVATLSAISEAVTNLTSSIYLAHHFGAIGVAYGTMIGAIVGVFIHFALSMRLTQAQIAIRRLQLLSAGILRPSIVVLPSIFWMLWSLKSAGQMLWLANALWLVSTTSLAWFLAIDDTERALIGHRIHTTFAVKG